MSKKTQAGRGGANGTSRTRVLAIVIGVVVLGALGIALASGTPGAPAKVEALATGRPAMYEFSTDS